MSGDVEVSIQILPATALPAPVGAVGETNTLPLSDVRAAYPLPLSCRISPAVIASLLNGIKPLASVYPSLVIRPLTLLTAVFSTVMMEIKSVEDKACLLYTSDAADE